MSKISKRTSPEDLEEGEASDCDNPVQSKNRKRSARTAGTRNKAIAEGIELGRRESADKIREQDQVIQEQKERIKRLTEQLALETAHFLLADQRSEISAASASALSADCARLRGENSQLEQRVTNLTDQLAQTTQENIRLRAQVAELAKPKQHSSYLNIQIPRKKSAGDGSL